MKPFKGIIYSTSIPEVTYPLFATTYSNDKEVYICTSKVVGVRYIAQDTFIVETLNSVYVCVVE